MKESLLNILYRQIIFFSENGKSNIDHPNFMIQETHKISGKPKKEVIKLFKELTEIEFIEKVPNEEYAYRIKNMKTLQEIKEQTSKNEKQVHKMDYIKDIICQVLVEYKSKDLIFSVLNEFTPNYQKLNLDYAGKIDDINYQFKSEDEMIDYYVNTSNSNMVFYWNKYEDNPDEIMVGVNITNDDKMIFSLTLNGTHETKSKYYLRLKEFLNSETGTISYVNPAEYENGNDFKLKYQEKNC